MWIINRGERRLPLVPKSNPFPVAVRAVSRAARRCWIMGTDSARTFAAGKILSLRRTAPLAETFHVWVAWVGKLRPVRTPMPASGLAESPAPRWSTGGLIDDHEASESSGDEQWSYTGHDTEELHDLSKRLATEMSLSTMIRPVFQAVRSSWTRAVHLTAQNGSRVPCGAGCS